MANAAKNRLEIQIVWPTGYWRMQGPIKGNVWTGAELIEQLEKALAMCRTIAAKDVPAEAVPPAQEPR